MDTGSVGYVREGYSGDDGAIDCAPKDAHDKRQGSDDGIPTFYSLAMCCDPELVIARAKANQDHQPHRTGLAEYILGQ